MDTKNTVLALLVLTSAGFVGHVSAETYQIEASVTLLKDTDTKIPGSADLEEERQGISGKYYLEPVTADSGPLLERPFITKSAFVEGGFEKNKRKQGTNSDTVDTIEVGGRFVTGTNLIFDVAYSKEDYENKGDEAEYSLGIGKYLDDRTTAILTYEASDVKDSDKVYKGKFRRLIEGPKPDTHIAYEFGIGYVAGDVDSGHLLIAKGIYFFSDRLSASGELEYTDYTDSGDFDFVEYNLTGTYFYSDTIFGSLAYLNGSRSDDVKGDGLELNIGMRF